MDVKRKGTYHKDDSCCHACSGKWHFQVNLNVCIFFMTDNLSSFCPDSGAILLYLLILYNCHIISNNLLSIFSVYFFSLPSFVCCIATFTLLYAVTRAYSVLISSISNSPNDLCFCLVCCLHCFAFLSLFSVKHCGVNLCTLWFMFYQCFCCGVFHRACLNWPVLWEYLVVIAQLLS